MKHTPFLIITILLFALPVLAQVGREVPSDFPTTGTIHLIALRVEFQADTTSLTTGTGKMKLESVDPPHNRNYFSDKLSELSQYFHTVSYGNLDINSSTYPVADSCYTLSRKMSYYSDPEVWDLRLNELFREAVLLADSEVDFSQNPERTAVMVIHAGAPISTDDFNDSPNDLASAFLPPSDFQYYLGGNIITDDGIALDRGMVVPEMTSQDGVLRGVLGTWTQIFGYQLGLPSMFDTVEGESRIGGWGLMDLGSSNHRGFSPAHPCAWSKIRMGWAEPRVIEFAEDLSCTLTAVETTGDMIKIPITSTEYFLLENREQDANGDGMPNPDEYDYSLPGSGLLIWHIDETVIKNNLETNSINNNSARKGVDLEEADGVQDFDEYVSGNYYFYGGFYRDPFFAGNNDRFASNTIPNNRSNSGTETHITIYDISEFSPQMTFTLDIGYQQEGWTLLNNDEILTNSINYCDLDSDGNLEILFVTQNAEGYHLCKLEQSGEKSVLYSSSTKILPPAVDGNKIWICEEMGDLGYYSDGEYTSVTDYNDRFFSCPAIAPDGRLVLTGLQHLYLGEQSREFIGLPTAPAVSEEMGIVTLARAPGENILSYRRYNFDLELVDSQDFEFPEEFDTYSAPAISDELVTFSVDKSLYVIDKQGNMKSGFPMEHPENISAPILAEYDNQLAGNPEVITISENGKQLYCWDSENAITMESFPKTVSGIDITGDFLSTNAVSVDQYLLSLTAGDKLDVFSRENPMLNFSVSTQSQLSSPMLADLDSDGDVELISISDETNLEIIDLPIAPTDIQWGMYRSDPKRSGSLHAPQQQPENVTTNYIENDVFYAYPNPALGGDVTIRYKLIQPPTQNPEIKIFDLSGDLIQEFVGNSTGSYNEVVWDISDIASGVYLCKIEVHNDVEFCKIAITK